MADADGHLEKLEELARERWGERWTIKIQHFATGSRKAIAYHSRGVVDETDDGTTIRELERLQIDEDGRVGFDRIRVRPREVLDVLERSELSAEGSFEPESGDREHEDHN